MISEFGFNGFKLEVWLTGCGNDSEAYILITQDGVCATEFYRVCVVSLRPGVSVPDSFRAAVEDVMQGVKGWRGVCLDRELASALRRLSASCDDGWPGG